MSEDGQAKDGAHPQQAAPRLWKKGAKPKDRAPASPSAQTLWAYWMQAIEPTDAAITQAFPGYHPQWVQHSQKIRVTPENFARLRRDLLRLTSAQSAAYLRVTPGMVEAWEAGEHAIPFMAFELLRLVYESTAFRLSHAKWDGWFIGEDGCFVSPDMGRLAIEPQDFAALFYVRAERDAVRLENQRLRAEIAAKTGENTHLRELFVNQGVVAEIATIRDRLGELFGQLNTARIFEFPPTKTEKAA